MHADVMNRWHMLRCKGCSCINLPFPYRHRLEEKTIENIGSALYTFLEYQEQLERMTLPKGDSIKQTKMYDILHLVHDMNN
jgi:hypothetical protein